MGPVRRTFDSDFFHRYYFDPATAVLVEDQMVRRARFVLSYLDFLGIEVASVLDVGCGVGLWRRTLRRTDRRIHVRSVRWYRGRLRRHFVGAGGGVFLPRRARSTLLALERQE